MAFREVLREESGALWADASWLVKHRAELSAITGMIADKANGVFFIAVSWGRDRKAK